MAWWQASGSSKDWSASWSIRDTFTDAARKVQQLAEQAEQEITQTRDQIRAQAQSLAEQAEKNVKEAADKVVGSVSEFGLFKVGASAAACSEEDLVKQFDSDANAFRILCKAPTPSRDDVANSQPESALLKAGLNMLKDWDDRIGGTRCRGGYVCDGSPPATLPLENVGLRALLRSHAMDTLLATLAEHQDGRAVLRAAASAASADPASDAAGLGEDCDGEPEKANGHSEEIAIAQVGKLLWSLMARCAAVPRSTLAQLLTLLADTAVAQLEEQTDPEVVRATPSGNSNSSTDGTDEAEDLSQDVSWVLALLAAALSEADEAALRGRSVLQQAVENALYSASSEASDASTATSPEAAEGDWLRQLDIAEAKGRSFRELRGLCAELSAAQHQSPEEQGAEAFTAPLASRAQELAERREGSERQAEELGTRAQECEVAVKSFEEQMSSSSKGFDAELATLKRQEEEQSCTIADLEKERDDLLKKLQDVEERLDAANTSRHEAALRSSQVSASAARVAEQLQQEMAVGETLCRHATHRKLRLNEAATASRDVEAALDKRLEELVELGAGPASPSKLRRPTVAEACLEAERARALNFEELLSGWHAAIWGPGAEALVRDPARLAMVRGLHMRAGALVEQAWRDLAQLDADTLHDFLALGCDSEDLNCTAERYKEMRQQLQANLERLTRMEAALQASSATTPLPRTSSGGAVAVANGPVVQATVAPAVLPNLVATAQVAQPSGAADADGGI